MASRCWHPALVVTWLLPVIAACAPSPESLLADARAAIASGEFRTAEIHLKGLLQQQPDNADARLLLGSVSVTTGDFAGAEQHLRRALTLGIDPAAAQVPLVMSLVQQGKFDEALAQLAQGPVVASSEQISLLRLEAAAQRGLRAYALAEAAYRRALEADPTSAEIGTDLAATLMDAGRSAEAHERVAAVLAEHPNFVPALLLRGSLWAAGGQYATAETIFEQVAELERAAGNRSGSQQLALARLVEVELAQGKTDEASNNAEMLLGLAPSSPIGRYVKASVEVQQKELDSAERRLETVIADAPQYWPAHRLLGAINVEQNQLGQAEMYLRTVVNNDSANDAARLQLAELYIRQGDIEAARKLMESSADGAGALGDGLLFAFAGRASQHAGLAEQAAEYFDQSERVAPATVQQLVGMSSMYVQAGEFARAVRILESASFEDPQSASVADYLLALVRMRQGDFQAADETAQRLVEQHPDAAWALNLRATIAIATGDLMRAHELLARAVALEPRNTGLLLNLARVAAGQNNVAEAERTLEQIVAINAEDPAAIVGLVQLTAARGDFAAAEQWIGRLPTSPMRDRLSGQMLEARGQFDGAASAFARAYAAQPTGDLALRVYSTASRAGWSDPDAHLRAWSASHPQDAAPNFALGSVALAKGQQEEAVRRYEAVLATNPNHAPTMNNLAWLYNERGDARALDFAKRAHAIDPDNAAIGDTLGWLHVSHGEAATGLPLLAAAAAGLPDQPEVLFHYGVALAETGDREKALETLERALAGAGNAPWRADAQERVAALRR